MYIWDKIGDCEMAKGTLKDRVLDDARNKALRTSHIPETIKASYSISIESGSVFLKKNGSRKGSQKT